MENHGKLTNARKRIQFFPAQVALRTDILGSDLHVVLLLWNCCIHIRLAVKPGQMPLTVTFERASSRALFVNNEPVTGAIQPLISAAVSSQSP